MKKEQSLTSTKEEPKVKLALQEKYNEEEENQKYLKELQKKL